MMGATEVVKGFDACIKFEVDLLSDSDAFDLLRQHVCASSSSTSPPHLEEWQERQVVER